TSNGSRRSNRVAKRISDGASPQIIAGALWCAAAASNARTTQWLAAKRYGAPPLRVRHILRNGCWSSAPGRLDSNMLASHQARDMLSLSTSANELWEATSARTALYPIANSMEQSPLGLRRKHRATVQRSSSKVPSPPRT